MMSQQCVYGAQLANVNRQDPLGLPIHVDDLEKAHLDALVYLANGGESRALNCGYGRGFSVREILETVRRVSGVELRIKEGPRREGDSPMIVANAMRIREVLGWKPVLDDINVICESAYRWEKNGRA